ncbi:MAG: YitT family protein [Clostridia bacterium]|nr:YitT family protein [Clostridia bacterium]
MPIKPKDVKKNDVPSTLSRKIWKTVLSYLIITLGTAIIAVAIYFFKFPNHFSVGGVSSLAVLLAKVFGDCGIAITESQIMSIANIALLIVALLVFGRNFAIKTIYSTVLLSVLTLVFEKAFPLTQPITDQKFLELILTIGGIAIGSAILFSQNASSGGTDVIAMIIKKFFATDIGTALLISDAFMAISSGFIFPDQPDICLYSIVGLVLKSFIVDNVIDGFNRNKCFIIVTTKVEIVSEYINTALNRGATVSDCTGSFTKENKKMIITVLNRTQAGLLKKFLKENDPNAFSIITNSSDIVGKGFRIVS